MIPTVHTAEPAYSVIERLGGKTAICKLLELDKSTLTRWCSARPLGTGGVIPQRWWPQLIVHARSRGIDLRLEDLAGIGR